MQLGMRPPPEVAKMLGSAALLREAVANKKLLPVVRRNRLTLYDAEDVCRYWQSLKKTT